MTAPFVQTGLLHVVANTIGTLQLGLILERLYGRAAFAAGYLGAGMLATLVGLAIDPVAVTVGGTGAVLGIHGLLAATLIAGAVWPSPVTIPLITLARVGPASVVFLLYSVLAGQIGWAGLAGLVVGFVYGLVMARGVGERPAPSLRVAASVVVVCIITVVSAATLRGVADVKPEIERVVAVERSTSGVYDAAVHHFQTGQLTTAGMADVIDRTILPELAAAQARLKKLDGVPRQHQPLVAGAEEHTLRTRAGAPSRRGCGVEDGQASGSRDNRACRPGGARQGQARRKAETAEKTSRSRRTSRSPRRRPARLLAPGSRSVRPDFRRPHHRRIGRHADASRPRHIRSMHLP